MSGKVQTIGIKVDTEEAEEAIARVNRLVGELLDNIEVARQRLQDLDNAGTTGDET